MRQKHANASCKVFTCAWLSPLKEWEKDIEDYVSSSQDAGNLVI